MFPTLYVWRDGTSGRTALNKKDRTSSGHPPLLVSIVFLRYRLTRPEVFERNGILNGNDRFTPSELSCERVWWRHSYPGITVLGDHYFCLATRHDHQRAELPTLHQLSLLSWTPIYPVLQVFVSEVCVT